MRWWCQTTRQYAVRQTMFHVSASGGLTYQATMNHTWYKVSSIASHWQNSECSRQCWYVCVRLIWLKRGLYLCQCRAWLVMLRVTLLALVVSCSSKALLLSVSMQSFLCVTLTIGHLHVAYVARWRTPNKMYTKLYDNYVLKTACWWCTC